MIEKVTLDTNVVLDVLLSRDGVEPVERLLALAQAGEVDLAVTRTIEQDVPDGPWASQLGELPTLGVDFVGGVARIGTWRIGLDHLGSGELEQLRLELECDPPAGRRLPDVRDWDHLNAHLVQARDVFLTRDGPVLALAELLHDRFGLRITRPEQYLEGQAGE